MDNQYLRDLCKITAGNLRILTTKRTVMIDMGASTTRGTRVHSIQLMISSNYQVNKSESEGAGKFEYHYAVR